jgi:hypothetical protein
MWILYLYYACVNMITDVTARHGTSCLYMLCVKIQISINQSKFTLNLEIATTSGDPRGEPNILACTVQNTELYANIILIYAYVNGIA